ncbi:hypothetical protein EVAR_14373_1 [Eumeta japonica]|uniref:Uncharacterized protein n=1 Tax=Eumeta variegata TaxID=151549 RepID=A0A4C1TX17_EUMVA|nr:hypothetical protein EVAR_14373_1 [Eumeta japonica]
MRHRAITFLSRVIQRRRRAAVGQRRECELVSGRRAVSGRPICRFEAKAGTKRTTALRARGQESADEVSKTSLRHELAG